METRNAGLEAACLNTLMKGTAEVPGCASYTNIIHAQVEFCKMF